MAVEDDEGYKNTEYNKLPKQDFNIVYCFKPVDFVRDWQYKLSLQLCIQDFCRVTIKARSADDAISNLIDNNPSLENVYIISCSPSSEGMAT